jgi:SAM-dependent methyltransferase
MPDPLAARYDAIPYRHGAVAESHPARTGAIARLLGIAAAPPDGCRVLELGCGEGMNLLPLAERFPHSEFTGLDISPAQIATGETARAACGIANARLLCGDLRGFVGGPFDYIIAHGVYSWVPDDAKDALISLIARALAPGGVAYVSYNVHPAAGPIASLRAIARTELDRLAPADEPAAASRLLAVLRQSFAAMPGAHAAATRALLDDILTRPIGLTLNDELAPVNDPVTFVAFNAHAARHGLRFLAEAHFASMPPEHLPAAVRAPLAQLGLDAMRAQQFLDLLGNRALRNSLLIRDDETPREPDATAIAGCAVGFHMFPADGRIDLAPGAPLKLEGRHGFAMTVNDAAQKAFFAALCEAAPARIRFGDACKRAGDLLRIAGITAPMDEALLRTGVLKLFTADQLDLVLAGSGEWLRQKPAPSPLMRWQAAHRFGVASRWHETVALSENDRRWLAGEDIPGVAEALLRTGLCG